MTHRMAFSKGFSPYRWNPGTAVRLLTDKERSFVGGACPHCEGALIQEFTPYSQFVCCPTNEMLFVDPTHENPFWRFRRETVAAVAVEAKRARRIKKVPREVKASTSEPVWKSVPGSVMVASKLPTVGTTMLRGLRDLKVRFPMPPISAEVVDAVTGKDLEVSPQILSPRSTPKAAPVVEPKGVFPYARFRKLTDAVQAAFTQGKLGSGFGLRRELMAARLWSGLQDTTVGPVESLKLAFALVGSERATSDEKPLYEELWKAQMGDLLYPLLELPCPSEARGEAWHPQAGLAKVVIDAGIPLWLTGEAGAGKTYLTRQLAALLGLSYVRLQGSRDRTVDDVIGAWGYDPAIGSVFRPGVVVETARNGGLLHIDEVAALPHEVTFELHAVLEGEPLTVLKNSGERIALSKTFRMVANDNSVGEGEQAAYVGLHSTNLAFRDRWAFLCIAPMPENTRKRLIMEASTK